MAQKIADSRGVRIHICGCKNPDITSENCYITRQFGESLEMLF